MQGMLAQQPPVQAPPQAQPQQAAVPMDAQKLQKHVNNVVKAAHIYMYGKQTNKHFKDMLMKEAKGNSPHNAAAEAAIEVIFLMVQQSQFKMSQKAVIPAGIMIAGEILDLLGEVTKHKITEQDSSATITAFIMLIKKRIASIMSKAPQQPQQQAQPTGVQ